MSERQTAAKGAGGGMLLQGLTEMSNKYGRDARYVLAGGGNTSFKERAQGGTMYVKGSGASLATIREGDFVAMDRAALDAILRKEYDKDDDAKREAQVLADMMAAMLPGQEGKRPSVEAVLHHLFAQRYVLHVHPALVNGMTCGADGEAAARELFGAACVWVPPTKPGYVLAKLCEQKMADWAAANGGKPADLVFLANHGVFCAADSVEGIDALMGGVMDKLATRVRAWPQGDAQPVAAAAEGRWADAIRAAAATGDNGAAGGGNLVVMSAANQDVLDAIASPQAFRAIADPFTPDHIVYCKAKFLYLEDGEATGFAAAYAAFRRENGYAPVVICAPGVGAFFAAPSEKAAANARALFLDAVAVAKFAAGFGGPQAMPAWLAAFIQDWEVESYRQKTAT